jgi:hypothetical protein
MWMTSSFHVESASMFSVVTGTIELTKGVRVFLGLALLACLSMVACSNESWAPDSPRAAEETQVSRVPSEDDSVYRGTIELVSVRVRKLDSTLERMAGPAFMKRAREPLAIEVETLKELPKSPRNTSAVLFLNSEKFADTWMILPNRLVAFLPDRRKIREVNTVTAAWTGSEDASRTKKPLTLRREDIHP